MVMLNSFTGEKTSLERDLTDTEQTHIIQTANFFHDGRHQQRAAIDRYIARHTTLADAVKRCSTK
jgi:hypothetical protein